ncbi:hypothetical protein FS842_000318 [Serendipita sp. 407]|nr:hypothetical protein FS842_000318 [Serendipita sp. 407]
MPFHVLRVPTRRLLLSTLSKCKNLILFNPKRTIHALGDESSSFTVEHGQETGLCIGASYSRLKDAKTFLELIELRQSAGAATYRQLQEPLAQSQAQIDQDLVLYLSQAAIANNLPNLLIPFFQLAWKLRVQIDVSVHETIFERLVQARQWQFLQTLLDFCRWKKLQHSSKMLNIQLRVWLHQEAHVRLSMFNVQRYFQSYKLSLDRESYGTLIEASIANQNINQCREIIVQMEAAGFPVNGETYQAILSRMVSMGPNETIEARALRAVQGAKGPLHEAILNSLIRLRSISGDDVAFRRHISLLEQSNIGPGGDSMDGSPLDITTIALLIEHLGRQRDLNGALRLLSLVDEMKLGYTPEIIAHMISVCSRCGNQEVAFDLFARLLFDLPPGRRKRAFKLLRRFGWERDPGDLKDLKPINVHPSVYILNALGMLALRKRGLPAVFWLLELMEATQVTPDDDTARRILHHLNRYQYIEPNVLIAILYRFMSYTSVRGRMRLANIAFHTLLKDHKMASSPRAGWKASATYLSQSRSPDSETHRDYLVKQTFRALGGEQDIKEMKSMPLRAILSSIIDSGASQDHATYSLRMFYYARVEKNPKAVEDLYRRMLAVNLQPNPYHIAALIDAYILTNQIEKAREMFSVALSDGIKPQCVLYTMLICAYGDLGEPEKGLAFFRKMLEDEVVPDVASLDAVIRGYFMIKEYTTARKLLDELWTTVLPLDTKPASSVSLKDSMQMLRDQERNLLPLPPAERVSGTTAKQVLQSWRRSSKGNRGKHQVPPTSRHLQLVLGNPFSEKRE